MGDINSKPKKDIEPEVLMRHMSRNPGVVWQYYQANEGDVEKFVVDNFWEEDVERWLVKIRQRSPSEALKVRKIDYLKTKNTELSVTSLYEHKELVVRRATFFDVDVHFGTRAFDAERDDITLSMSLGSSPSEVEGTKIVCPAKSTPGKSTSWYCQIMPSTGTDPKVLTLRVNIPADAIVARYVLSLDIVSGTKKGREATSFAGSGVIVLFNPFSQSDTVYMADEEKRKEYVLNDEGFVCQGSYWRIYKKQWDFAQFDDGVLDDVLKMLQNDSRHLDNPLKSWKKRHNPVYVSRVLSAMVNCNDDKGVLYGRWDGEYEDGKSPSSWSSSAKILQVWADNGMKPVKYGQCWVFSGVLTTALRALGIPGRSITNFASAHDTDANVTVDMYYDADSGDKLDETSDSVWNFHVWNEGYFARPDLPEGYGGWQVLDATPQEVSEVADPNKTWGRQIFQCGPCPVKAVKEGAINIGFDTNFVFGEVNADKVIWNVSNGKLPEKPSRVLNSDVGKNISTKAVGSWERHDVTLEYKYAEGTPEEREAFKKAYGRGSRTHGGSYLEGDAMVIPPQFEVKITPKVVDPVIGSDISTTITVKNISSKKHTADIKVAANSKRHIGLLHTLLKKVKKTVELDAGKSTEFAFDIPQSTYMSCIVDNKVINIRVMATNPEDGNTTVEEDDLTLGVPEDCFTVAVPTSIASEDDTIFDVVFENKLPMTLTKGSFDVFIRGNKYDDETYAVGGPLEPGEKFTIPGVKVQPRFGWKSIYCKITFEAAEVGDIEHSFRMNVKE